MRGLFEGMKVKYKINSATCKRAYAYLADILQIPPYSHSSESASESYSI